MAQFETIVFDASDNNVATITLNRPDALNSFNTKMLTDMSAAWKIVRETDAIHAVVLRASPGKAFCTGVDVWEKREPWLNPFAQIEHSEYLCPKHQGVWKPVVTAVHGMAAGGAFYFLNESDVIICSEEATFFDPHVTYGMVSAIEPIGMNYRMHLGDVLRMVLLGNDERVGAATALRMGLVSEVVPLENLWARAAYLAERIAAKPTIATQGTVRAVWEALDMNRRAALDTAIKYCQLGNPIAIPQVDRAAVMSRAKQFEVR